MFDQGADILSMEPRENDFVACRLLKHIDRYEQFAILHSADSKILKRVFSAAFGMEEYEICQVIKDLMEERKMMSTISYDTFDN